MTNTPFTAIRICFMLEADWKIMAKSEPVHPSYRDYAEVVRAAAEDMQAQGHTVEIAVFDHEDFDRFVTTTGMPVKTPQDRTKARSAWAGSLPSEKTRQLEELF